MAQTGADAGDSAAELGILYAVAEALNSAADVRQALERTLELVAGLLGLRTGWVWLLDPETSQFYSAAAQNLPPYLQEPVRMAGTWCECIQAFRDGDLAPRNVDVIECSRLLPAVRRRENALTEGLRYHATIPLTFQDRPLGIMNVTGPAWRRLSADELRLLSTIAYQVGVAVERGRLAEESTRLARAEERARLAREIHDTLAQGLSAIALHVEGALRALDHDAADSGSAGHTGHTGHTGDGGSTAHTGNIGRARERLERALATARESLEEARRSVQDLRAAPPGGRPLGEALAALARTFTSDTGIRVHVRVIGTAGRRRAVPGVAEGPAGGGGARLPLRVEAELYRIAQEALENVRKHAQAQETEVTLRHTAAAVRLTVHDDGRGLPATLPEGEPGTGHGIQGMRERARLLGGDLRVAGRPGRGTTVVATVPIGAIGAEGEG
jgi:two-component system, NarL family, sensor kinase